MNKNNWKMLFSRYYVLTHNVETTHHKTLISNYKYIFEMLGRLIKKNTTDEEIYEFLKSLLEIHCKNYGV